MANEITEELLEKIRKFPERYRVIEQNPLEHYLDIRGDEVRFEPIVFKKDLANNPQNIITPYLIHVKSDGISRIPAYE